MNVLDWLQANSGAVTAVATVILVAITGIYVALTARLAEDNRLIRHANTEPYVAAYLLPDETHFKAINIIIANIGAGPALGVCVRYLCEPEVLAKHPICTVFVGDRITAAVLPPGDKIISFFGMGFELLEETNVMEDFDVEVTYTNLAGEQKSSRHKASIKNLKGLNRLGKSAEAETAKSLQKIADAMERWSRGSSRLLVNVITPAEQNRLDAQSRAQRDAWIKKQRGKGSDQDPPAPES